MSTIAKISPLGLKVIKAYEGYRPEAATLVTGQSVIGYGHAYQNDDLPYLSKSAAEALLIKDLEPIEHLVLENIYTPLTQSQFDALCSLAYNIGDDKFLGSNVRHALNNGRVLDAAAAFDEWRKAEIGGQVYVVDALMRRRTAEKALFLRHDTQMMKADRLSVSVQSDESYQPVSDEADIFNPDTGIVDHVPQTARSNPQRRREDGPLGMLTLSEVAPRSIYDPQTTTAEDDALGESEDMLSDMGEELPWKDEALNVSNDISSDGAEDIYQLSKQDIQEGDDDISIPDARLLRQKSPIAEAAAEVKERLDTLIDTARLSPESESETEIGEEPSEEPLTVLGDAPDIAGQPKPFGAEAYIRKTVKTAKAANGQRAEQRLEARDDGLGAYMVFMIIGGCLLAAGLVTQLTKKAELDELMSLLVPLAIVIGAMMVIGTIYYMARHILRRS